MSTLDDQAAAQERVRREDVAAVEEVQQAVERAREAESQNSGDDSALAIKGLPNIFPPSRHRQSHP